MADDIAETSGKGKVWEWLRFGKQRGGMATLKVEEAVDQKPFIEPGSGLEKLIDELHKKGTAVDSLEALSANEITRLAPQLLKVLMKKIASQDLKSQAEKVFQSGNRNLIGLAANLLETELRSNRRTDIDRTKLKTDQQMAGQLASHMEKLLQQDGQESTVYDKASLLNVISVTR